jgi:hypothetical protein
MAGSSGSVAGFTGFTAAGRAGWAAFLATLADFFALCDLEDTAPAGAAFESAADCAATGVTSIENESRPAKIQAASREPETEQSATFIVSL